MERERQSRIPRRSGRPIFSIGLVLFLCSRLTLIFGGVTPSGKVWEVWERVRVSPSDPYRIRHEDLEKEVTGLVKSSQGRFRMEVAGHSVEGRELFLLQWGEGPLGVLLWSQMHGNEPTATAALLDLMHYLEAYAAEPAVLDLKAKLHLYILPMLNPDGAERTQRRNAQGIDINRDALALSSPEARTLKAVRDRFKPGIGFNLHDQNPRISAGTTLKPVIISLLAVPFDEQGSDNPGRIRSKKICSRIYETLEACCAAHIARYDDSFNPRAFGDQMTAWGTPTVLIESGSPVRGREYLTRLNFLALLDVFEGLADGTLEQADPAVYEGLPENTRGLLFDWILKNVRILPGTGTEAFETDVAINFTASYDRQKRRTVLGAIEEIGDLSVFGAIESIDASGWILSPSDLRRGPPVGEIAPGSHRFFLYRKENPGQPDDPSNLELLGILEGGVWKAFLR